MKPSNSTETNPNSCTSCGGPIEPARQELNLTLCFSCADTTLPRPLGNVVTIDSDSNTELDIVQASDLPQRHITRKNQ